MESEEKEEKEKSNTDGIQLSATCRRVRQTSESSTVVSRSHGCVVCNEHFLLSFSLVVPKRHDT
jgi:hypothetical protein